MNNTERFSIILLAMVTIVGLSVLGFTSSFISAESPDYSWKKEVDLSEKLLEGFEE